MPLRAWNANSIVRVIPWRAGGVRGGATPRTAGDRTGQNKRKQQGKTAGTSREHPCDGGGGVIMVGVTGDFSGRFDVAILLRLPEMTLGLVLSHKFDVTITGGYRRCYDA